MNILNRKHITVVLENLDKPILINLVKNSSKTLFLTDGFQDLTILAGAGILMDNNINEVLSSCVTIVDYRRAVTQSLELRPEYHIGINTNTVFQLNGLNRSTESKSLCSSVYTKNVDLSIFASCLHPFIV